jgi:hypothetical protein
MPTLSSPCCTAFSAYSIWPSLPDGLKVVSEKLYRSTMSMAKIQLISFSFYHNCRHPFIRISNTIDDSLFILSRL